MRKRTTKKRVRVLESYFGGGGLDELAEVLRRELPMPPRDARREAEASRDARRALEAPRRFARSGGTTPLSDA